MCERSGTTQPGYPDDLDQETTGLVKGSRGITGGLFLDEWSSEAFQWRFASANQCRYVVTVSNVSRETQAGGLGGTERLKALALFSLDAT